MKFFYADWLKDTRILSPEAKGVWIDLVCFLWDSETRGTLTHTLDEWGRILGILPEKLNTIFLELENAKICNFAHRNHESNAKNNAYVTLSSRRILKEERLRENTKKRVGRYRQSNAIVTP